MFGYIWVEGLSAKESEAAFERMSVSGCLVVAEGPNASSKV